MNKPISTQSELLQTAKTFEAKYPDGRGFTVTTVEYYNDNFEIRAYPSVAKALLKSGLLRVTKGFNGAGRNNVNIYHVVKS